MSSTFTSAPTTPTASQSTLRSYQTPPRQRFHEAKQLEQIQIVHKVRAQHSPQQQTPPPQARVNIVSVTADENNDTDARIVDRSRAAVSPLNIDSSAQDEWRCLDQRKEALANVKKSAESVVMPTFHAEEKTNETSAETDITAPIKQQTLRPVVFTPQSRNPNESPLQASATSAHKQQQPSPSRSANLSPSILSSIKASTTMSTTSTTHHNTTYTSTLHADEAQVLLESRQQFEIEKRRFTTENNLLIKQKYENDLFSQKLKLEEKNLINLQFELNETNKKQQNESCQLTILSHQIINDRQQLDLDFNRLNTERNKFVELIKNFNLEKNQHILEQKEQTQQNNLLYERALNMESRALELQKQITAEKVELSRATEQASRALEIERSTLHQERLIITQQQNDLLNSKKTLNKERSILEENYIDLNNKKNELNNLEKKYK